MPRPATYGFASFLFRTFEAMIAAQAEIGRTRQAADILGAGDYVPPYHNETKAKPIMHVVVEGDAEADAQAVWNVCASLPPIMAMRSSRRCLRYSALSPLTF